MGIRFPCAAGARYVIGGSAPPDDGHHIFKECHSEERSDVGIRIPHMGVRREDITDVPVAVPKIFALPYGGRLKF